MEEWLTATAWLENEDLITKPEDRPKPNPDQTWVKDMTDEDQLAVDYLIRAHLQM